MFGSGALEIAIGLVLVFLLTSLIMTAVIEGIESWLKSRAVDLEKAIGQLLQDDPELLTRFYQHPLIYPLYRGAYPGQTSETKPDARWLGKKLPSYIPRENFSAALIDLVHVQQAAGPQLTAAFKTFSQLAGDEPARLRVLLEGWYDSAMDRAAGWYKRRAQSLLFWIGLVAAAGLNINAVLVAQYLSSSASAREQVAAIGTTVDEQHQSAAAPLSAVPSPAASGTPAPGLEAAAEPPAAAPSPASSGEAEAAVPSVTPAPTPTATGEAEAAAKTDPNILFENLADAGLPIGWNKTALQQINQSLKQTDLPKFLAWLLFLSGYLITALAGTLGAPFWFDMLNKLIVIRATVKPREKSPDEAPVDGPNPAPANRIGAAPGVRGVLPAPDPEPDCCATTHSLPDNLVMLDEHLPAATGGVERPASARQTEVAAL